MSENQTNMNYAKLMFPLVISAGFICLGFYLINKYDDFWPTAIGYANIIFFSGLIIFAIGKIVLNRKSSQ